MRRALPLAGIALAVLVTGAPARADAPGFQVQTAGVALRVTSTQSPAAAVFTAGLVDASLAFVDSTGDASSSQSRASALYPGDLVANGAQLVCSQFLPCPTTPPDYPLLAEAEWPSTPRSSAGVGGSDLAVGPLTTSSALASALATLPHTSSTATTGGLTGLATSPLALSLGAATTTTDQRPTATGTVVTIASTVSDIALGPLHISSLHVRDAVVLASGKKPVDTPTVTASGVSFAGQSATVDATGVHVAGHDTAYAADQLALMGLTARLIGTSAQDTPHAARSTATGLALTYSQPVSGVPAVNGLPSLDRTYLAQATVGSVGIAAATVDGLSLPTVSLPVAGTVTPVGGTAVVGSPGQPGTPGTPGRPGNSASSSSAGAPTTTSSRPVSRYLPGLDLRGLTLALLLGTLLAFFGGRVVSRSSTRRRRR